DSVSGLETALDSLCRKELIHRREFSGFTRTVEYSFKHELLRNVAYDELSKKAQREHHAQVAQWFIGHGGERINELAGLVAVHFEKADFPADAAEWYGRAGQQALTGYAPAAAVEYFQKALTLLPAHVEGGAIQSSGRLQWHEGLSQALTTQGR